MKKSISLFALVALIFFASCKKESIAPPVATVPGNERLLLSSNDTYNTYAFEYNSDRTIKRFTVNGGTWDYVYAPNKLTMTLTISGVKRGVIVNDLVNGICQKQTGTYYDANGVFNDEYVSTYFYNNKGLLVKETYTQNGLDKGKTERVYDSNDDMIEITGTDENGVVVAHSTYEYYTSLPDKSGSFGQFNSSAMGSIFPKRSQHLQKRQTTVLDNKHYNYTYTMDAKGYVLASDIRDDANALIYTVTNTWE